MKQRVKTSRLAREGAVQTEKTDLARPQIRHPGGPAKVRVGKFFDADALDRQGVQTVGRETQIGSVDRPKLRDDVGLSPVFRRDDAVETPRTQRFGRAVVGHQDGLQRHARKRRRESRHEVPIGPRVAKGDPKANFVACELPCGEPQRLLGVQHRFGPRKERLPRLRQNHLPAFPTKERDVQDLFEPSNRHGEGRLGDVKRLGRFREGSRPSDDEEMLQLTRFHDRLLCKSC